MDSGEQLREALYELNRLRNREAQLLAQSRAVLDGLEQVVRAASPDAALQALLSSVKTSTECDAVVLLEIAEGSCRQRASTDATLTGCEDLRPDYFSRGPRQVVDLQAVRHLSDILGQGGRYRSMISAPTPKDSSILVLICLSTDRARLDRKHLRIAERLIALAAQTLATKELADENQMMAAVIERSSTSFAIADADIDTLPLIFVNDAFEGLTGYAKAEALGRAGLFLSADPASRAIKQRLDRTLADRGTGEFELRNYRKDGRVFWNQVSVFPVASGDRSYMVATQRNVTDRVAAEAERDTARRELEAALASVCEGMLLLDQDDRIVFANDRFRTLYQLPPNALEKGAEIAEACLDGWRQAGHSDEAAQGRTDRLMRRLTDRSVQNERKLSDGLIVLETVTETLTGGTACVVTDVTALKTAQSDLSDRISAIDAVQDGIVITDASDRVIYANPSHLSMFGYGASEECLGRVWFQRYADHHRYFIQSVALPRLRQSGVWRGDIDGHRADGVPVQYEVSLTSLKGGRMICITRDISGRIKHERERAALRDQLNTAQRQEALGQLAAGLAHDFNNCLSVITGSATLVREADRLSDAVKHADRIGAASAKATDLTRRLLQFGARQSERRRLDLREPLSSAVDLVSFSMPSTIDLSIHLPKVDVQACADPTDILQVVMNLAINARDAIGTAPGSVHIALKSVQGAMIEGHPKLGKIDPAIRYGLIRVEDTGHGLREGQIDELFQPYFTTKGDQGGTGLGLSVVKSLVASNQAALLVQSRIGAGTVFEVAWPLDGLADAPTQHVTHDQRPSSLQDLRIMVVDDDETVSETLANMLEQRQAEVVTCEDGAEALEAMAADPSYWDVVITDYDMPGMTGAELGLALRGLRVDLPLILYTGVPKVMGNDREGSDVFSARLAKPVDPGTLVDAVLRACKR